MNNQEIKEYAEQVNGSFLQLAQSKGHPFSNDNFNGYAITQRIYEIFLSILHKIRSASEDRLLIEVLEVLNVCLQCLTFFRNACAYGSEAQNYLIALPNLLDSLNEICTFDWPTVQRWTDVQKMCWQLIGNLCVGNENCQNLVADHLAGALFAGSSEQSADICRMILFNIYIGSNKSRLKSEGPKILKLLLKDLALETKNPNVKISDFLQIFLEHFVAKEARILPAYGALDDQERLLLLYFIADYMKDGKSLPISKILLQYVCKEFKKKSDCVLKTVTSYVENIRPVEVIALLEIISIGSGQPFYSDWMAEDPSLFLNVGCLLQAINSAGKNSENIFTPVQKLDQVAPNSANSDASIERDISYELKTMLVKTISNLVHENRKNQDLAREMEIIASVLDCTGVDARNPLIKEFSILAIRNLCERNTENQQFIANLTRVGDADNSDILKEFNIDLGSLRIGSSTAVETSNSLSGPWNRE